MYSLDINFLNDRQERPVEAEPGRKRSSGSESSAPMMIGLVLGLALPALTAGAWAFYEFARNPIVQEEITRTDGLIGEINAQQARITEINTQVESVKKETQALATVFDQIKPWSAILQDIRDRIPANVRLGQVQQLPREEAAAQPVSTDATAAPVAAAPPTDTIRITGLARSFNDVNDFVLTLQRSPFLIPAQTRLVTAQLVDDPTQIELSEDLEGREVEASLPQVVQYTVETQLTDLPASALLPELERNLAVGLTARIQALRDRGVLQP